MLLAEIDIVFVLLYLVFVFFCKARKLFHGIFYKILTCEMGGFLFDLETFIQQTVCVNVVVEN
jgi:hypothetical protein